MYIRFEVLTAVLMKEPCFMVCDSVWTGNWLLIFRRIVARLPADVAGERRLRFTSQYGVASVRTSTFDHVCVCAFRLAKH
jgi:hypothetical protein